MSLAILLFSSVCFAEESTEVSLGGIRLGMSYEEVIAMYGEPTAKFEKVDEQGRNCWDKFIEYGDAIQITFSDKKGSFGVVESVFVTANNGWALPSGIKVGSKESDFKKIYPNIQTGGKGWYGLYYKVEIAKNIFIGFSTPDTGNSKDTITSLQITTNQHLNLDFERKKQYVNVTLRPIK